MIRVMEVSLSPFEALTCIHEEIVNKLHGNFYLDF